MPNPTRAEAIKRLLDAKTQPDLAGLYHPGMETQVNVARDDGVRKDGYNAKSKQTYTDGVQTWFAFRIPKNAWAQPEDNSSIEMTYALFEHAEGIGMTGWCFSDLRSHWVAFDFDSIVGHSERHAKKMTDQELEKVRELACAIPWVTVRKSASGNGLHLYVHFATPVPTKDHTEHAALAKAVLAEMSALAGFDFQAKVDTCGGNMWIWHRKMPRGSDGTQRTGEGLKVVRTASYPMQEEPKEWHRYLKVVKGERKKSLPSFAEGKEANFEETSGQQPRVPLDAEHKSHLDWALKNGGWGWWDADHHMWVTHTWHLRRLWESFKSANFPMKGNFKTSSPGSQTDEQNCFSGSTKVMTIDGPRALRELASVGSATLLVQGRDGLKWKKAQVKSFGTQTTFPVIFGDGSTTHATADHQWLYYNPNAREVRLNERISTKQLCKSYVLPQANIELPVPDMIAYAHGFVFGDGWVKSHKSGNEFAEVAFFKEDEALINLVCKHGTKGSQVIGGHKVWVARNLPSSWKELPKSPTREYAFGFLLGLISADGFVAKRIQVQQSNFAVMLEIERLAIWVGCRTSPLQVIEPADSSYPNAKTAYKLTMSSYNFNINHFLRADHKRLLDVRHKNIGTCGKMVSSMPTIEEVFCAIVPNEHNFVLANGVITGNCFLFPMRNGAWSVRRYSPGAAEDPSWDQDGKGWTRCYFNRDPDLRAAARGKGGVETDKGSFQFSTLEDVEGVVKLVGGNLEVPAIVRARPGRLSPHKDGRRVVVIVDQHPSDDASKMKGWYSEKGKEWRTVVEANAKLEQDNEVGSFDDQIRHCTNETKVDAGWFVKVDDHWNCEPKSHVAIALMASGKKRLEADLLMGASVQKPWVIVNRPFEDEYPGDRTWNRSRVRLRFPKSDEVGDFSTWRKVLAHIFKELDGALVTNGWAVHNDVKTGGEWAELWIASMIQNPYAPLPYIFAWSDEQDTGKSTFHEMMTLIITEDGIIEANRVVEGKDTFNGQMEGAVLCYIEELDLQKNKSAYERIKNWVTSPRISIRKLYVDAYQAPNTAHFYHSANNKNSFPIFHGDTRVVIVNVPVIAPKDMIPKPDLMGILQREAPHFLNHVLQLEIPPSGSRLAVPVIATRAKEAMAAATMTALEKFLDEFTHHVPGSMIKLSEFFDKFREQLEPAEREDWKTSRKVSEMLPLRHPVGKRGSDSFVGNISWEEGPMTGTKLVLGGLKGRILLSSDEPVVSTVHVQPEIPAGLCQEEALGHKCARSVNHQPPHVSTEGVEW